MALQNFIAGHAPTIKAAWLNLVDALLNALPGANGAAQVGFTQSGTGAVAHPVQTELRSRVSVFQFMTDAQIADVQAGTVTLDISSAFASAFATGNLIHGPKGTYRLNNPALVLLANSGFVGEGRGTILSVFGASTPSRASFNIASPLLDGSAGGCLFRDFVVQAGDTFDYTKTYESWTAYNYTCNNHLVGIVAGTDTIIENVHSVRMFLPIAAQSQSRIKISKCSSDRSAFSAIWTGGCSKVEIIGGDYDRCGAFGGIVCSNVNDLTVTGIPWLFNPESTGIDIGGGGTTSKRIAITGNNVFSGDPIGVEDGGSNITITGNQCAVAPGYVTNIDLTGINCQLHDVTNTPVNNIVISGNGVCFLNTDLTYHDFLGTCIDVGGVSGGQNSSDVTISGNMCRGGEAGIDVHGLASTTNINLGITGNNCTHNFYGLKLETTSVGHISGNHFNCGKTTTVAGTYGIYMLFGDIKDVVFSANTTIGYATHIQQDVPGSATNLSCTRSIVQTHSFLANPGDVAAYIEYVNSGSGTDLNLRPLRRFQTGLATANTLVLGKRGNKFAMTGTTQINIISNVEWNNGDEVQLHAQGGATTVKNAQASSGVNKTIVTSTGADWVSGAGGLGVLSLVYDATVPGWRETGRVG